MKKLSQFIIIALVLFTAGAAQAEWSALGAGMDNSVYALAFDGSGNLYPGGSFTTADGNNAYYIAKWNTTTSAWIPMGLGLNGGVTSLAFDGSNKLYVGGGFTDAGGNSVSNIAKWNTTTFVWAIMPGINDFAKALAFDGSGNLYAGGRFTDASGVPANYIAKFDPGSSTWSALDSGMNTNNVNALLVDSVGNLYAGGDFVGAGGVGNTLYIAKWDPITSTWSALGSGMDGHVTALAFDSSGNLYAGGGFTTAGGVPANHIAKWDPITSTWSALGSGLNDTVFALAFDGSGNLYAGGYFSDAGGVTNTAYIAKWDPTTSTWSALGSGMDTIVYALAFDGSGNLYAGGDFTTAGGVSANYIAKWTPPPCALVVSSIAADGTYGIGASIPIDITFSRAVNVTGTPQLTLETGTTDAVLNYASGSGTDTLIFNYTVASGHTSADLEYVSSSSLALNGGTIKSLSGIDDAILTLPAPGVGSSLGVNKDIILDAVAPTITSITSTTADGTYGPGSTVNVTVNFSKNVTLAGGNLTVNLDAGTGASAVISAIAGTNTASGTYNVVTGHNSPDLNSSSVSLAGGATLKDAAGNSADLTIPAGQSLKDSKAIVINTPDTIPPTVVSVTSSTSDGTYGIGGTVNVTVNFSENVTLAGGNLTVNLDSGGTVTVTPFGPATSGSGTYIVAAGQSSTDLNSTSLTLAGGATIKDGANNAMTDFSIPAGQSLKDSKAIVINTTVTPPVTAGVSIVSVTNVKATTALATGTASGTGIGERGFFWWNDETYWGPNASGLIPAGYGAGDFSLTLTGLPIKTKLYVSAYIKVGGQTITAGAGNFITITTTDPMTPTVITKPDFTVNGNEILAKGEITDVGSSAVTIYGFVYAKHTSPTVWDMALPFTWDMTLPISQGKPFEGTIKNLSEGKYYFRSYAHNAQGTAYGEEFSFTITGGGTGDCGGGVPGDLNGDGNVDLGDVIIALKILDGIPVADVSLKGDVNGDCKIGMEEAIFVLQKVGMLR